jgi:hypothetical protein
MLSPAGQRFETSNRLPRKKVYTDAVTTNVVRRNASCLPVRFPYYCFRRSRITIHPMRNTVPNLDEPAFKWMVREVVEEVTRPQFAAAQKETQRQFETFKVDFRAAVQRMVQEFKDDIVKIKDEIVAELQASREESTIHKGQHERFDEIEQRIEKLERIHPHSTQPPA